MSNYSKFTLTSKLAEVEAQAATSTEKITWGRMVTSSDVIDESRLAKLSDKDLTALSVKQSVNLSGIEVSGNKVSMQGVLTSTGNAAEYQINTIFITANYKGKEFLAGASIATGQATSMPRGIQGQEVSFIFKLDVILTSANSVQVTLSPAALVTEAQLGTKTTQVITAQDGSKSTIHQFGKLLIIEPPFQTPLNPQRIIATIPKSELGSAKAFIQVSSRGTIVNKYSSPIQPASLFRLDSKSETEWGLYLDEYVSGAHAVQQATIVFMAIDNPLAPPTLEDLEGMLG